MLSDPAGTAPRRRAVDPEDSQIDVYIRKRTPEVNRPSEIGRVHFTSTRVRGMVMSPEIDPPIGKEILKTSEMRSGRLVLTQAPPLLIFSMTPPNFPSLSL